ncbi:MAG: hypothetical protein K8T89_13745 [Planctomycetes bacterium]|nr:hypothetical protein [Planctomycetota bacterium]
MRALAGGVIFGLLITLLPFSASAVEKDDTELEKTKYKIRVTLTEAKIAILRAKVMEYQARNNLKVPAQLEDLVPKDDPSLLDGWGKKFQYDPKGPRNEGASPDIWTETPDKKIIGNWTEEKK